MKTAYSSELKKSTVQKILMPGGPSVMEMAKKTGAHHTSIRKWIKNYGNVSNMKKSKEWTPEKKLEAIIKTASMNENELGEYLRTNGIHSSELEQWKQDFYSSQRSPGRPKKDPQLVNLEAKEKQLKKELRRKEKALAEMSARVILLKKSQEIFGDSEEDE